MNEKPAYALDPQAVLPDIPEGWRVLWCPVCLYGVTFTENAAATYSEAEWQALIREAAQHDHE